MAKQFALVPGASSGIGFYLAKELAGRGLDLAISSSGERLQGAAEKLRATGERRLLLVQPTPPNDENG